MPAATQASCEPAKRGAWLRPMSFLTRVYSKSKTSSTGKALRNRLGSTWVTTQAPAKEPSRPRPAPGSKDRQGMTTLRLYCTVAKAVPQIEALLLVPNKVAGGAPGKAANRAGSKIRPPPPTIESTRPASSEASETISNSMLSIVALGGRRACRASDRPKKSAACAAPEKSHLVRMLVHVGVLRDSSCLLGPRDARYCFASSE